MRASRDGGAAGFDLHGAFGGALSNGNVAIGGSVLVDVINSNTQAYIADVIEKIAGGWPASRWDELMPWNWQPQQPIAQAA